MVVEIGCKLLSIYPYFISHSLAAGCVCVSAFNSLNRSVFSGQPQLTRSCQFPAEFNQFMCHYPIVYQISGRHPIIHAVVTQFIHFVCLSLLLLRLAAGVADDVDDDFSHYPSMCRFLRSPPLTSTSSSSVSFTPFFLDCSVVVGLTFQLYIDSSWDCCQCSSNIYCQFHIF